NRILRTYYYRTGYSDHHTKAALAKLHRRNPSALRINDFEESPSLYNPVDTPAKSRKAERFISTPSASWWELDHLEEGEDHVVGKMFRAGCAELRFVLRGPKKIPIQPAPKRGISFASTSEAFEIPPRGARHRREPSPSQSPPPIAAASHHLGGATSDTADLLFRPSDSEGLESNSGGSEVSEVDIKPALAFATKPVKHKHSSTSTTEPRSPSSFLEIQPDLPNAPSSLSAQVSAFIQRSAEEIDITLAPTNRLSLTSQWIARWDEIERIGRSVSWEMVYDEEGESFTAPVGPRDIAAVLGWGIAVFSTHLQSYKLFVAHQKSPYLFQVIESRGALPKKVSELQALLSQVQARGKVDVKGISKPSGSRRHYPSESDSSEASEDSSDDSRHRHSKKKARHRSHSPLPSRSKSSKHSKSSSRSTAKSGVKGEKRGSASSINPYSVLIIIITLLTFRLFPMVSATPTPRLSEIFARLPASFTALDLYFLVALILYNYPLVRRSRAQEEFRQNAESRSGFQRHSAWTREIARLAFGKAPVSTPLAEAGRSPSRILLQPGFAVGPDTLSLIEEIAAGLVSDIPNADLRAANDWRRVSTGLTVLASEVEACLHCEGIGYLQKATISTPIILLDCDGPREAAVVPSKCSHCRTVFWPDRYRIRLDDEAVYVYDSQAKYIRLGTKYWASRRLANNFLLQHYHHNSFSAVNEIYHESYDPQRLSKATSTHFFTLFIFHIILLHSESTGIPFLSSPVAKLQDVIKSADQSLFARGRRIVSQHSCTKCSHVRVEVGAVHAAGNNREAAQRAHDGADLAVVDEAGDDVDYSCAEPRCANAPSNYRSVRGRWCTDHSAEFFAEDAFDISCGVIACEQRMVRKSVVPNPLIPNDSPLRIPDETDEFDDRYPVCDEHLEVREFYLSRYGAGSDFHAVQRWGRNQRNNARDPDAARDAQPWQQKQAEETKKILPNTWHTKRWAMFEVAVRPCGVPVSATRMLTAESDPEIVKFLEETFAAIDPTRPASENRPSILTIDRACKTLAHLINSGKWFTDRWDLTTRLIVDLWHYLNHLATDELCVEWCNPAPLDGSQPNLVVTDPDNPGRLLRAFNTEAAEQLNAWIVGFAPMVALVALPASSLAQFAFLQDAGNSAIRKVLSTVLRFNSTQVDRVLTTPKVEAHPYAVDLTDQNWETLLRTGSDDPFGASLPDDTIWCVSVYGQDQWHPSTSDEIRQDGLRDGDNLTDPLVDVEVRRLPQYAPPVVTLTPSFSEIRAPIMVIGTNGMKDLRFFRIGQIAPFLGPMSDLLQNQERWETMPIWRSGISPGGSKEWIIIPLANAWAIYHKYMSQIPSFVLLIVSGMMMNFVVGIFHKEKPKAAPGANVEPVKPVKSTVHPEVRREQIKARLAEIRANLPASPEATPETVVAEVPVVEGSTAVKKGKASKRK
ncbi:hypothetical protein P7C70_g4002, partial [Phenoliferia sp. Uapishka_3]